MRLTGAGRLMREGDISYNKHTGLQERKVGDSVVLEIGNLKVWRKFKSAQERNLRQQIADPPLSPQVRAKQERAAANLAGHRFGRGEGGFMRSAVKVGGVLVVVALAVVGWAVYAEGQQQSGKVAPECLAGGGCWEAKADAPVQRQDCLRTETFDAAVFEPSVVFVPAEGRQPNGAFRLCADVNFCQSPVPNGWRYTFSGRLCERGRDGSF